MPLSREERKLLHQKSKQPTLGVGRPDNEEGYEGDISFRKVEGSGTVEYVKQSGEWVAIASSGEMPAVKIIGGTRGGVGGGVTSHDGLTGLADDDHTQYLLIDGTRDMAGNLGMSTHSIVLTPSTDDTATISSATNGVLNITTVDTAAAAANIVVTADGKLDLNSVALDIDASGAVTIDGTSTISIDGADDMNFTITSSTGAEDLTIQQIGANDSSIIITAAGTGADAISIDATAGSMVIGASLVDQKTLTLGNTSSTYLKLSPHGTTGSEKILLHNAAGTDDESIKIHSVAGGITIFSGSTMFLDADNLTIGDSDDVPVEIDATSFDLDASSWIRIDGTEVSIDGTLDSNITVTGSNKDLTLSVVGGSTQTLTISSAGTGTNAIDINATAGGVDIDANGAISLDSAAGSIDINVVDGQTVNAGLNGAVETIWAPHGTAGSELWSTINTAGTTDGSDAAGAILLSSVAGGIGLAWADGKDLWAEGGKFIVTANEDDASCIKLHADAGSSQTITIVNDAGTSVAEGTAAVQILSTAGGVGLRSTANLANAINLTVDGGTTSTMTLFNDQGTAATEGAASIQLLSDVGGINIKSGLNNANAILLTADGGTSETIVLHSDQGTGAASIGLVSDAGGITLDAGADILLDSATDIVLDAAGGNFEFKDAGTTQLTIDVDGTAGDIDINLNVNGDDLVFNQFDGTEVMRITDTARVGIGDATPESLLHIKGADPVLTIQDTETSAGSANARIRLAETDGSGDAENYWDIHHSGVNFLLTRNDGTGNVVIRSCYVTDFAINIKAEAGGRHYTSSIADFEQNYSMVAEHFVSTAHNPDYGDV